DTNEEVGRGTIRCCARHRNRAVAMPESGHLRGLERDRRKRPCLVWLEPGLDDGDLDLLSLLVVGTDGSMEPPEFPIETEIDVAQEVGRRLRGVDGVHLDFDLA